MKSEKKPRLKTGAYFVSGSLKITRKTDEEQERAAQADRSVLVVRTIRVSDSAAVVRCFTRYFVPKIRSPASPNPGKM